MSANQILFIILLITIIFVFIGTNELFEPVGSNQFTTREQDYKSDTMKSSPEYYSQLDYKKVPEISCCLVEKKYLPNPTDLFGGNFTYAFSKKTGDQCDLSNYNINSNKQILIEGDNGWSNQFCSNSANNTSLKPIGSCRNINKECIDFVDKNFCDKYRMKWSSKTCHQPLEFTWVDPINLSLLDIKPSDGTFKMF